MSSTTRRRIAMQPGEVRARLTVIQDEGAKVLCRCECGTEKWFFWKNIRSGATKSCGCLMRETQAARHRTHGLAGTPTYISWQSAKSRCTQESYKDYSSYGGRGIFVCDRWFDSFENFLADMGERPAGMTLERRDVDGPYSPENCEWATHKDQTRNRRNTISVECRGVVKPLGEWCEELGLDYRSAFGMHRRGKAPEYIFANAHRLGTPPKRPSKLTAQQAAAIFADPRRQPKIAKEYGCDQSTVSRIKAGRAFKDEIALFLREEAKA